MICTSSVSPAGSFIPPAYRTPTGPERFRAFRVLHGSCYKEHEVPVLYLERIPAAPLNGFVRMIWYAQAGERTQARTNSSQRLRSGHT